VDGSPKPGKVKVIAGVKVAGETQVGAKKDDNLVKPAALMSQSSNKKQAVKRKHRDDAKGTSTNVSKASGENVSQESENEGTLC